MRLLAGFFALIAAGSIFHAPAASAQEPAYIPTGEWELSEGDESCQFSRPFRSGGRELTAYLTTYGPVGAYRFSIVGEYLPHAGARAQVAEVSFDTQEDAEEIIAIRSSRGDAGLLSFQLTGEQFTSLFYRNHGGPRRARTGMFLPSSATRMTVDAPDTDTVHVEFGSLEQLLSDMDACEVRLAEGWDYDDAAVSGVAQHPELLNGTALATWIRHPEIMMLNRISTVVQLRMTVSASGEVEDCVVQLPNWDRRRTRTICRAIERGAEFAPARNDAGEAISALYRFSYLMVVFD